MKNVTIVVAALSCVAALTPAHAQTFDADAMFRGLTFRAIGPATPGGRQDDPLGGDAHHVVGGRFPQAGCGVGVRL